METVNIAPVDLNSFMCGSMNILGFFNREIGNISRANHYETMHQNFIWINDEVFYNKTEGGWYDFNNRSGLHILHNYPSIAVPLFTNCYNNLDYNKPRRLFDNLLVR
jgi:alpha,alpha-trehalase